MQIEYIVSTATRLTRVTVYGIDRQRSKLKMPHAKIGSPWKSNIQFKQLFCYRLVAAGALMHTITERNPLVLAIRYVHIWCAVAI